MHGRLFPCSFVHMFPHNYTVLLVRVVQHAPSHRNQTLLTVARECTGTCGRCEGTYAEEPTIVAREGSNKYP